MPIITNNLETEQDIADYKAWLSGKRINSIKRIKRMLEVDKIYRPNHWRNIILRIELMDKEIKSRES